VHGASTYSYACEKKGKNTVYPGRGPDVPEGEQRYSSTLSLISVLDGGR
jgi:hypothetical protein